MENKIKFKFKDIDIEFSGNEQLAEQVLSIISNVINNENINNIPKSNKPTIDKSNDDTTSVDTSSNQCSYDLKIPKTTDDEIELRYGDIKKTISEDHNLKVEDEEEDSSDKPKYSTSKVFACPECNQWLSMLIDNNLLIRDYDELYPTLHLLLSTANIKNNSEIVNMSNEELSKLILHDKVEYELDPNKAATCICCGKESKITDWHETYMNKISNDMCPSCNGFSKSNNNKTNSCMSCNLTFYDAVKNYDI